MLNNSSEETPLHEFLGDWLESARCTVKGVRELTLLLEGRTFKKPKVTIFLKGYRPREGKVAYDW